MDNASTHSPGYLESSSVRGGSLASLPYEEYAPEVLVREFLLESAPGAASPGSYFGLSPFEIPESVTVELSSDDRCVFRFSYPNTEPPELSARVVPSDSRISLLLAQHTKKILEVTVTEARGRLRDKNLELDVGVFHDLARQLPAEAVKACLRNSALIRIILFQMPVPFREEIVARLSDLSARRLVG